jgi:hypothetical protein
MTRMRRLIITCASVSDSLDAVIGKSVRLYAAMLSSSSGRVVARRANAPVDQSPPAARLPLDAATLHARCRPAEPHPPVLPLQGQKTDHPLPVGEGNSLCCKSASKWDPATRVTHGWPSGVIPLPILHFTLTRTRRRTAASTLRPSRYSSVARSGPCAIRTRSTDAGRAGCADTARHDPFSQVPAGKPCSSARRPPRAVVWRPA